MLSADPEMERLDLRLCWEEAVWRARVETDADEQTTLLAAGARTTCLLSHQHTYLLRPRDSTGRSVYLTSCSHDKAGKARVDTKVI